MSQTIDEKVVEMRFDNKQFESNVQTSMSTIDKLKKALNLKDASKGLENVEAAAKNCNMSPLSNAVEAVGSKFSALSVIGITALANLANSAVNAGKRIVSALTIDPIKTGFQEYELKMGSIQTIMASTDESLETVNGCLDELNTYADKTIYSFSDMTQNIGKFTNAGVSLKDSVAAIQGVSNVAAVSGANANEASRAMYNFAQALSAGYVKHIDWKSIEYANMATVEFKNYLLEAAAATGTLTKTTDGMYKTLDGTVIDATHNFNESLQEQWMTTEALVSTLKQYADETTEIGKKAYAAAQDVKTFSQLYDTLKEAAQSGWAQTWEIIVGDFNEAKVLLKEINEFVGGILGRSADNRNSLLEGALGSSTWGTLKSKIADTGIEVDSFKNKLVETAKEHGVLTDEMIAEEGFFEKAWKSGKFTGDLVAETLRKYTPSALEVLGQVTAETVELSDAQLKSVGYTDDQIKAIRELAAQAEATGTPINDLIAAFNKPSGRELIIDSFRNALKGLVAVMSSVRGAWVNIFPPMTSEQLYEIIEKIHNFSTYLLVNNDAAQKLRRSFEGLFSIFKIISTITGGALKIALEVIGKALGMVTLDVLDETAAIGDAIVKFKDWLLYNGFIAKAIDKITTFLANGVIAVKNWIKAFAMSPKVQEIICKIGAAFGAAWVKIKDFFSNGIAGIKEWVSAFSKLPVVQESIVKIGDAFSNSWTKVKEFFIGGNKVISDFINRVKQMDGFTLDNIKAAFKDFRDNVVGYFLNIDFSFDGVKAALKNFKDQTVAYLDETIAGFKKFREKVVGFFTSIRDKVSKNIGLGEILTAGLGVGTIVMLTKLGDVLGFVGKVGESAINGIENIVKVFKSLSKYIRAKAFEAQSVAIKNLAISIAILAGSLFLISKIDPDRLWGAVGALAALAGVVAALSAAMGLISKLGGGFKTTVSLVGFVAAIAIIVGALKSMQELNAQDVWGNIGKLGVIAAGLIAVSVALNFFNKGSIGNAVGILGFVFAIKLVISALKDIDGMPLNNIESSLSILGRIVGSLILVILACSVAGPNALKAGIAILAIATAVRALVKVIKTLSQMTSTDLDKGLGAVNKILLIFAGVILISKLGGKNSAQAGASILAMSVAISLMIGSIKTLAKMDGTTLDKGLNAIKQMMKIFALIIAASLLSGKNAAKAGVMLLMMSVAIGILAGVMVVLSHIDPSGLQRALDAVTQLGILFGGLIAVTTLAKNCKSTLIILTVAVGILAVALGMLSMIEPENLKASTTALSIVIGMFGLLVASTALMRKGSGTLLILTLAIGVLAGALYLLARLPSDSALDAAKALSLVIAALSASLFIVSRAGMVSKSALLSLGFMTLVVGALSNILLGMSAMDVGTALGISASLSLLILSLSGACALLSLAGGAGASALVGIGSLLALIVAVGGLMVGIGALATEYPGLESFLDKGLPMLEKIGYGLGSFLGNIVGGAIAGLTAGLPDIGTNLSSFMENLEPFTSGLENIKMDSLKGIGVLAGAIITLTAADLIMGIGRLVGGEEQFAGLAPLGTAIAGFSAAVDGNVKPDAVKTAAEAGSAIATVVKALAGTELLESITDSWKKRGQYEGLALLGTAIAGFSAAVDGNVKPDAVKTAAEA
ncbi:MAG: tape measure protein, partial [Clostridia bacterium]